MTTCYESRPLSIKYEISMWALFFAYATVVIGLGTLAFMGTVLYHSLGQLGGRQ